MPLVYDRPNADSCNGWLCGDLETAGQADILHADADSRIGGDLFET